MLIACKMKKKSNNQIFLKKKKPILKACLNLLTLPWQRYIRQLNYEKTEVFVVNLLLAAILVTKGSGVLAKKVNETQLSKTVLGHLNVI